MHDEEDEIDRRLRRNSRCRCGSWRTYRQCCWEQDERRLQQDRLWREPCRLISEAAERLGVELEGLLDDDEAYARFAAEVGVELPDDDGDEHEHVDDCARYDDVDVWLKEAGPFVRERARDPSLRWHLGGLTTSDLLVAVREAGVTFDPEEFRAASRRTTSAWALGVRWRTDLERAGVRLRGLGTRPFFVEFASCVLWARFVPERLSQEQVEDLFGLGHVVAPLRGKQAEALEAWRRAWLEVERWLHPEVDTIETARLAFVGAGDTLPKYVDALSELLFGFAQQGNRSDPHLVVDGIDLMDRFLLRFRGEPAGRLAELEADLAEVSFRTGARNVAEELMAGLRLARPADAVGYVRHALLLTERWENVPPPSELGRARALALLETARDRPLTNGREWDLAARIAAARAGRRYEPPRDLCAAASRDR